MNSTKKHIEWIDTARGIAILLVILGHMPINKWTHDFIYSFHMPLFFIISGFFIAGETALAVSEYIKKKYTRLIIPYLFFGILIMIPFSIVFEAYRTGDASIGTMSNLFSRHLVGHLIGLRNDWPYVGLFWFLPCLFCSLILIFLISKYCGKYVLPVVVILSAGGFLYNYFISSSLPFSMDLSMIAVLFLMIGSYFFKHSKNLSWSIAGTAGIIGFIAFILNGRVEMYDGNFNNPVIFLLSGTGISIFVLKICMSIKGSSFTEWLGLNTLLIYMLHYLFRPFIAYIITKLPFNDIGIINFIYCIAGVIVVCILLYPIIKVINRYLPYPIGNSVNKKTFTKTQV